jgi:hypothetical protein
MKYKFFKDAKGGSGDVSDDKQKGKFRKQFGGEDADERAMRLQEEAQERARKKKEEKSSFSKIKNLFK